MRRPFRARAWPEHRLVWLLTVSAMGCSGPAPSGLDLSRYSIVDLTHAFDENTIYWPTSPSSFELQSLSFGETPGGWFYATNAFCTPEHGGTHLDAPIHFYQDRWTTEQIPVDRFVRPAVVLDVRHRTSEDSDYPLCQHDLRHLPLGN